ncbi:MAG: MarR family winged helix-turn-helix transcriptional regulator [Candidatus Methanomethylophilus sp.]|jgi:DNA-binding MarR family transcriptional regulator|nr:MarR family winged helix-turn-helix transcriptional regulator [Methanomethylophilus sp.]MCI2075126.1 MarR family winged helix-turn-helix transcriptional regulator [Methanomethylophilus sp.]MCI2092468.1 MarR family winged helix-turn-helix transcriptional regulator [Methanomethylophilus sp.]
MEGSKKTDRTDRLMDSTAAADRLYQDYAKSVGMSYTSLLVLDILYDAGPISQKEISEAMMCSKQSVNQIVRALWEKGYAELSEDLSDRRNKQVRLTESGTAYAEKLLLPLYEASENAFDVLGAEKSEEMIRSVIAYTRRLSENIRKMIAAGGNKGSSGTAPEGCISENEGDGEPSRTSNFLVPDARK